MTGLVDLHEPSDDIDVYQRAAGRAIAQLLDEAELPRHLFGTPAWWTPDPNPFPAFHLLRWRRRRLQHLQHP